MARPPRIELAGGLCHVTSRGGRREPIYRDDQDRSFLTGVYTMREIAEHSHLHRSTVNRAVRWIESQGESSNPYTDQ
jgi:hypothetical protein